MLWPGTRRLPNRSSGHFQSSWGPAGAQVYKGVLDDVREVAIKFLCDAAYTDELTVSRFAAEVQVLKACRDPNVVNCLGAWLQKVPAPLI